MLRRAAATTILGPLFKVTQGTVSAQVNKNSSPSGLKITDMRACRVAANYDYPIIKIYTNQDLYGLGEVRDAGVEGIALILKPFLLGRNPLDIETILRSIRQFAGWGRMSGGYSAVDMALHDISGKVYGVPAYRLLGPKVRDRIRIYADTTDNPDPKIYSDHMRARKEMGITFFKMDLHSYLLRNKPGAPQDLLNERGVCTEKGLGHLCEYIQAIRDVLGDAAPLAADHFGPLTVNDGIRYAKAFEKYQLAWAEDMVPWTNWRGLKEIKEHTTTPILTGEDIFGLQGGFDVLIDNKAVDAIHPDIESSGGLLETKRIADHAALNGIQVAMHHAGSPVGGYAGYHCAATFTNFLAMENHALDMPWWQDLVSGVKKPIIDHGYVAVPETPGLGIELNDDVVKAHLRRPGYFEPTPMFNDRIVSGYYVNGGWPHYTEDGKWCDNCESDR